MNDNWHPDDYRTGHTGPYPSPSPALPMPQRRHVGRRRTALIVGLAVAVPVIGGWAAFALSRDGLADEAAHSSTRASKPVEQAPGSLPHDGTLIVGRDVKPGTYQAVTPARDGAALGFCTWMRLRATDGEMSSIIAGSMAKEGDSVVMTIEASDEAVKIAGCGSWTRVR